MLDYTICGLNIRGTFYCTLYNRNKGSINKYNTTNWIQSPVHTRNSNITKIGHSGSVVVAKFLLWVPNIGKKEETSRQRCVFILLRRFHAWTSDLTLKGITHYEYKNSYNGKPDVYRMRQPFVPNEGMIFRIRSRLRSPSSISPPPVADDCMNFHQLLVVACLAGGCSPGASTKEGPPQ